ncbi:hypothetical protein BJ875DRAFT_547149 [Amylocarpus encephaloides]|uniref:NACHT-NTPase and P-loop NTPases N-terminal domain-containing protein n=1 Tax=Amylocarpus encephaloides TaxID=45428 RepID=A0A9P7YA26_9HELO|nr:hypothetical protein BJ875DRAFT_547149 [Amylocarpus encephaloides]
MSEALAVIGIVSSIIQLVDFSSKVVKRLDDLAASVGEVPRAFRHIKTELPLITESLRRIKNQARTGGLDKKTIDAVDLVIKDCQGEIMRLESILDRMVPSAEASKWERRRKALLSLTEDKHVEEIAKSLGRYVQVLTLHLVARPPDVDLQPPPTYGASDPTRNTSFTLIPFDRNAKFVEREYIFKQIDKSFETKEGSQPKAALFGLGGIGKSQIALEYCFRKKEKDPGCSIFWVHAATLARFEETYKRLATECGLANQGDTQVDITQLVQDWLESRHAGRWLMVVDNIDDADVFFREKTGNNKTLSQYIPRSPNGLLLFTTRSRDIAVDLLLQDKPIAVPVFTRPEGASLLRSRLPSEHSDEQVLELLVELEFIPLAITQAAAFMSKRRRTIPQYLDLYKKSDMARLRMLSYEFSDHGRQSAELLSLMAYFDRHAIPSTLLYNEEEDLLDFEDAVAVLVAFSLIDSDESGTSFDMHNLVQLATKRWLISEKGGKEDEWGFKALSSLSLKFPEPQHHPSAEYWSLCASFLPHAQLILAHPFKSPEEKTELARATLLLSMARYLHWRGAWIECGAKTEEAFQIRKRILGEKNQDTLRSLGQLAWANKSLGAKNVELGEECLQLRREVLGENHPETIDCLSDLADSFMLLGEYRKSEAMQRQALEASQRVLGPEHPDTLNCLGGLASVLADIEEYGEAETVARKTIRLKTKVLGENTSIFSDLHNLAYILVLQEKFDEAEEAYRHVLALKEKKYGQSNVETLATLSNLVILLGEKEKFYEIGELTERFEGAMDMVQEDSNPTRRQVTNILKSYSFFGGSGNHSSSSSVDSEE